MPLSPTPPNGFINAPGLIRSTHGSNPACIWSPHGRTPADIPLMPSCGALSFQICFPSAVMRSWPALAEVILANPEFRDEIEKAKQECLADPKFSLMNQ